MIFPKITNFMSPIGESFKIVVFKIYFLSANDKNS